MKILSHQTVNQGLDASPQPLQGINNVKMPSHHPVLLLVDLYEGVLGLVSLAVHLCAHGVRIASHARVVPLQARLAP